MYLTRRIIHTSRSFTGCSTYPISSYLFDSYDQSLCRPNVPLSATSPSLISNINSHTKYIPPHPQKGTPYHRYTVLLLPQKSHIDVPVVETEQRLGFSLRQFLAKYDFDPSTGGGAHMWRGEWNSTVSGIYRDLLSKSRLLTLKFWMFNTILVQSRRSLSLARHQNQTGTRMSGERIAISCSAMGGFACSGSAIRLIMVICSWKGITHQCIKVELHVPLPRGLCLPLGPTLCVAGHTCAL